MSYIILFDIPRNMGYLQVKINRLLHSINAQLIQHSVWESEDLNVLKQVSNLIKEGGGKAIILEKKIVE
ncbi:MAG: hypothetical protein QMD14_00665 [Candidatus Aenigmarchaeota archaeon]|nr:hypothetical protein [Candidatus Aenigmarchaeota archaeon]